MVKCLNIGKNIGQPIYRSISSFHAFIIRKTAAQMFLEYYVVFHGKQKSKLD